MRESIVTFYNLVNADNRVRVVVLTGHGKMFCAGADLDIGWSRDRAERDIDHRDGYVSYVEELILADRATVEAVCRWPYINAPNRQSLPFKGQL